MIDVDLRTFANLKEPEILTWLGIRKKVLVKDDFGNTLETNTDDMMISWYGLNIHRAFGEKRGIKYHVKEVLVAPFIDDDYLQAPINYFTEQLNDYDLGVEEVDYLKQYIHIWQNKINNFIVILGQEGVIGAMARDVVKVMAHPAITKIKSDRKLNKITIDEANDRYRHEIMHNDDFNDSNFVDLARTGGVSVDMGYQLMVELGQRFDINNKILPNSIEGSYAEGILNLADILAENRSAGKALQSNGPALKSSEFLHRKIHQTVGCVREIDHTVDCGNTMHVPLKIVSKPFLKSLLGKIYFDDDNQQHYLTKERLKNFKVGETIKIRSIINCRVSGSTPCHKCYGNMSVAIPYNVIMNRGANIGIMAGSEIAVPIGQGLLSTKHLMKHTTSIPFEVFLGDEKYINTDGDNIYLNENMIKEGCYLILPSSMNKELSDLSSVDNLEDINEDSLTNFSDITFKYEMPDPMVPGTFSEQIVHVHTSVSTRRARMSKELIEYVIQKGWEKDKKEVIVDLSGYDLNSPLLFLPYMHEDLDKFREEVEQFISMSRRNKLWLAREVTEEIFGETLSDFWHLINRKFKGINIIHQEVILHSVTAVNPFENRYELPFGNQSRYFIPFSTSIANRGMGNLLIYQDQCKVLERPSSYEIKNRNETPFEHYLMNNLK